MDTSAHSSYRGLVEKVTWSHERGRTPATIDEQDIALARLYSYAFRLHTIGTYHSTRLALLDRPKSNELSTAHRTRAVEVLEDLANLGMELVPTDFRVVLSTFFRYHQGVERVTAALRADRDASGDAQIDTILNRFIDVTGEIIACNGIHLTRDTGPKLQASFIVPTLGITIVPLVYGDHHSWNLAWLDGPRSDVPAHRHQQGVEIHLGYSPMKGYTIHGDEAAEVTEGYAMPIPPMVRHGYTNASDMQHHVPFVFGSLRHGGWGVFLDVEAQPASIDDLRLVSRDSAHFRQTVYLEREIKSSARSAINRRRVIIPAAVTDRGDSGGLELSITRVTERAFALSATEGFLAVSVVNGGGIVTLANAEQSIQHHDHFGIPRGMAATIRQVGDEPLVLLDAAIKRRF